MCSSSCCTNVLVSYKCTASASEEAEDEGEPAPINAQFRRSFSRAAVLSSSVRIVQAPEAGGAQGG
jgi:hypothetical protein